MEQKKILMRLEIQKISILREFSKGAPNIPLPCKHIIPTYTLTV